MSYLAAVSCGVTAAWPGLGAANPVVGSLMASMVFLAGMGIVLQVIGSGNLPDLKIRRRGTPANPDAGTARRVASIMRRETPDERPLLVADSDYKECICVGGE